ncbi:hypothetical protein C8Q70DRAFT_1010140 [Cubamyces menziesii]|uniref:Yeast cell wall synthesis Kre9/Knh1-like N-terminal domain-containing protein n=1 Tax=Trametes cubensis TaxID=1111947 RepID=A0AAD7TT34_9APHY|nr:hypothetical protein C8Q70DRAFT_1010140 [Cubamyces menziesii]KAJ8481521.1 hypothetical protein ONZ51_g5928 [Trametes cubensis]
MNSHIASSGVLAKSLVVLFALFGVFFQLAAAVPVADMEKRDVWDPQLLYPHAGTIWYKGQTHNVTWDNSNPPSDLTDPVGLILLKAGSTATPLILADGFNILDGRVEVTVPWVLEADDYSLVLFGDSSNVGPQFTILQ